MKRLLVVLIAVVAFLSVTVSHAAAAKGKPPTGTCAANPNPVATYTSFTVTASGLPTGSLITRTIQDDHGMQVTTLLAQSDGSTSGVATLSWSGTATVRFVPSGNGNKPLVSRPAYAECAVDAIGNP